MNSLVAFQIKQFKYMDIVPTLNKIETVRF